MTNCQQVQKVVSDTLEIFFFSSGFFPGFHLVFIWRASFPSAEVRLSCQGQKDPAGVLRKQPVPQLQAARSSSPTLQQWLGSMVVALGAASSFGAGSSLKQ